MTLNRYWLIGGLLLLTGARKGEALNAQWDQFDLNAGVWVKPHTATKQRTEHRVPLSAPTRQLLNRLRDRDDDSRQLGRGPGSNDRDSHDQSESRGRSDQRGPERDRDVRDRGNDPRDAFTRHLDLPRGRDREIVHDARGREYTLRGSESRSLSTVAANCRGPAGAACPSPAQVIMRPL